MSYFEDIKKDYPEAFLGNGLKHAQVVSKIKKDLGTDKAQYTYIIAANNQIFALGKGTDQRARVFSPLETDLAAGGHIKGGIAALINIIYGNVERIFIPAETSREALETESLLKVKYHFHDIAVKEISDNLIQQRLKQLQQELPASIYNEYIGDSPIFVKVLLRILGDPSGNDFATMKKVVYDLEKEYPGTVKAFNIFFKGGFKPLAEPSNKSQTSLFEILRKMLMNKVVEQSKKVLY